MKIQTKGQRGQAMIMIVFALIGLIAIIGLAVDGGLAFSDRRHAQNAADTAAMAGAVAKINAQALSMTKVDVRAELDIAAKNMAGQNGYNNDLVLDTVEVFTCDEPESSCENYAGNADYVQVIIHSDINTFFAGVLGIPQMHNRVQAIALAKDKIIQNPYNGDNVVALRTTCGSPSNFSVSGDTTVHVISGAGLFVNTGADSAACGFICNSDKVSINSNITTAGSSIQLGDHCKENFTGIKATDGTQLDFPVTLDSLGINIPSECTSPAGTYTNYATGYPGYETIPVTVLTPGAYSDFPPNKVQPQGDLYDTILMQPGVYCVNHVVKLIQTKLTLIGSDVTFFLRQGYEFDINGGSITLSAPDNGPYAGYLMILEPDYNKAPLNCKINGNVQNTFTGAIFAPYCNINIDGGAGASFNSQIIGYTINIGGNSTIHFSYDAANDPRNNQPAHVELIK